MGGKRLGGRRGVAAVAAFVIIAAFAMSLVSISAVIMEYARLAESAKRANELVAMKESEGVRVMRVSADKIEVYNYGSIPVVVAGYFKVNPAGQAIYVKLEPPAVVAAASSMEISVDVPEGWRVGVVTSNGNAFWEEPREPQYEGELVPPGQMAYVTFAAEGLDSYASGSVVLRVDGQSYAYGDLPKTFAWASGSTHSFEWISPVQGSGARYLWTSTRGLSTKQSDSSFTVSANGYIIATYKAQYRLTTSVSPSGAGSVSLNPSSPDGYYDAGTAVTLTATASSGYAFDAWTGDASGTSSSTSITMNSPKRVTANFFTFSISVNPSSGSTTPGGSVTATVTVTYQSGASPKTISFSASGLPSGASASFSPNPVTVSPSSPTATSTMTISTSTATPSGTYTITITGSGGGISKSAAYTLTVNAWPTRWYLREHQTSTSYTPDVGFSVPSPGIIRISSTRRSIGQGYLFIVLPKDKLHGSKISVRWNVYYTYADSRDLWLGAVYVIDAALSRDADLPIKGIEDMGYRYVTATHYPGPLGAPAGWLGWRTSTSNVLDLSSFTSNYVTLLIRLNDGWVAQTVMLDVDYVQVLNSFDSTIHTWEFTGSVVMERTGTLEDYGYIDS